MTKGRVFDAVFGVAFVLSIAVQFNDPDPLRWILIYGLGVAGCASPAGPRWSTIGAATLAVVAGIWALTILPAAMETTTFADLVAAMSPDRPQTEAVREFGGLLLLVVWAAGRLLRVRAR